MKRRADPVTATALWNHARLYETQRRFEVALEQYEAALEMYEELAKHSPEVYLEQVAQLSQDLGLLLHELDADEQAMVHLRRAVDIAASIGPHVLPPAPPELRVAVHGVEAAEDEFHPKFAATMSSGKGEAPFDEACRRDLQRALHRQAEARADLAEGARLALEAIAIAERVAPMSGGLHLAKGAALSAYRLYLRERTVARAHDDVFRTVAALREAEVLLTARNAADSLSAAQDAMRCCGSDLKRQLSVVVAEDLGPDGVFLGVLTPDHFNYEIVNPVPPELRPTYLPRHMQARLGCDTEGKSLTDMMCGGGEWWTGMMEERAVGIADKAWRVLPTSIRELLAPDSGFDVGICGDSTWTLFPWEALRFTDQPHGWLGLHRLLPRWQAVRGLSWERLRHSKVGSGNHLTGIVCPWNVRDQVFLQLPEGECDVVGKILARHGYKTDGQSLLIGAAACRTRFEQMLLRRPEIIHYSGHGEVANGEEHLVLFADSASDRDQSSTSGLFGREQLHDLRRRVGDGKLLSNGPVIVLNACHTGAIRQFGGLREDLASAFLAEGACAVVATAFSLHDQIAGDLGASFYREACADPTRDLGDSLVAARILVAQLCCESKARPLWAAMAYHGNPYVKLV